MQIPRSMEACLIDPCAHNVTMASPSLSEQIVLRAATAADLSDISRIMNHPPEPPMSALLGHERASRLGDLLVRAGVTISLSSTTVAVVGDSVVGVMDCGSQYGLRPTPASVLRLLPRALLIIGLRNLPRALRGMLLRQRVQFASVAGAYSIAELYVDERLRNRGIGGALLRYAEEEARRCSAQRMCVETGIENPARRLYERNGYHVVTTKADAQYERVMGSPGRVLMLKELSPPTD